MISFAGCDWTVDASENLTAFKIISGCLQAREQQTQQTDAD
jgi:hypothetical protein